MNDRIEAAIDAVAQRAPREPAKAQVRLIISEEGYEIGAGGALTFTQPDDPSAGGPRLLILDPNIEVWRPVTIAPGTWRIGPDDGQPAPRLWQPGMPLG